MDFLKRHKWLLFCLLAILIRLCLSQFGYNYDLESYNIVSEIVLNGENVYSNTSRYNYSPIWAGFLAGFKYIANILSLHEVQGFHLIICLFLSLVDVSIASILKKNFSTKIGLIFLFNPISLLITGFHSQFDNFAVLFGLLGWMELSKTGRLNTKSILFFSFSLAIKHILLFFLPVLFLFPKKSSLIERLSKTGIIFLLPFLISIPFLLNEQALNGFVENTILYRSFQHGSLLYTFFDILLSNPNVVEKLSTIIFVLSVGLISTYLGYIKSKDALWLYLVTLVAFSSSISDQYFAIPLIAVALFYNYPEMKMYTFYVSALLLLDSPNNIGKYIPNLISNDKMISLIDFIFRSAFAQLLLFIFLAHYFYNLSKDKRLIYLPK